MNTWHKGDRCVARRALRLRVDGAKPHDVEHLGLGPRAGLVHVKAGTGGTVEGITPTGLLVRWDVCSTDDPVAVKATTAAIFTPGHDCAEPEPPPS